MERSRIAFVVALCIAPTIGLMSTNLLLPTYSFFNASGLDTQTMNRGVSFFLLAFAVAQLTSGFVFRLRFARAIVVYALAVSIALPLAYVYLHPSQGAFVLMRIALGFTLGVVVVGCRFLISRLDAAEWRRRGFVFSQIFFNSLPVLATLISVPLAQLSGPRALILLPAIIGSGVILALFLCNRPRVDVSRDAPRASGFLHLDWSVAVSSSVLYSISYGVQVWLANLMDISSTTRVAFLALVSVMATLGGAVVLYRSEGSARLYTGFVLFAFLSTLAFFVSPVIGLTAVSFSLGGLMPLSLVLFLASTGGTTAVPVSIIGSMHLVGGFAGARIAQSFSNEGSVIYVVFVAAALGATVLELVRRRRQATDLP